MQVGIVGGGIGGLTAALALHARGIACRVYEAVPQIRPLGVGINLLPHATAYLEALGVLRSLEAAAVATREAAYYNRFGQLIHLEPLGRAAGYATPQLSIHRGELQMVLLDAVLSRLGPEAVQTGRRCLGVEQDETGALLHLQDSETGATLPPLRCDAVVAADGIHSVIRRGFFPEEGPPVYSGVNMWRGVTRMQPILSGATMVRAGWLAQGKMVIYPIRTYPDGLQLMNWVAEIETPHHHPNDWARPGRLEDFLPAFADWHFDWLDVPAMIRAAEVVLEYPMVDKDPLPRWSHGRVTLLGDAAHPMYPRGSNGAGQAILDAKALAECLSGQRDPVAALKEYEDRRLGPTAAVVRTNRSSPPDAIIREVWQRSGDKPFARIEDVISREELTAMLEGYKKVAGYDRAALQPAP
ncbi:flavin-dependent oxidoreductase [Falsiroseomonas oryzae]|uniref:flavin-dependent oxidoreductase n=1 Tax=Falsiroseomonas oryzae TaxID=2766473 RepID=UPI0022EA2155|nr:flavin-dependent oxidoreductase [Roseomonas sp. MO-31]